MFGEVCFLGRGEGAVGALKGANVAVRHDVALEVAAVGRVVVAVAALV